MTEHHLSVYATSDLHAHWRRTRPGSDRNIGGLSHVAAFLADVDRDRAVLIDNGDTLSGSVLGAWLARSPWPDGHPVFAELERIGFDVAVPGNHDFDHGLDRWRRHGGALRRTRYLCANCLDADGAPILQPSTVLEREGIKIGVIGAVTGHVQRLTRYDAVAGARFVDPVAAVRSEAARLRPLVDVLLVSYHGGIERDLVTGEPNQYDKGEDQGARILAEVPGIDGLVAGHQHRTAAGVVRGASGEAAFLQPGYAGESIGVMRFVLRDNRIVERTAQTLSLDSTVPAPDAEPSPLAHFDLEAQAWFDGRCSLADASIHSAVAERTRAAATVLALPAEPRTWRQFAGAFEAPYGTQRYRMPRAELEAALTAAAMPWSAQGIELFADAPTGDEPEHVEFVANSALHDALPDGRVQEAHIIDWLDEFAVLEPRILHSTTVGANSRTQTGIRGGHG